jgi:acyl transferase domain-containing protein
MIFKKTHILKKNGIKKMDDAIAVIGLGCRFPGGANDPYTFFSKLKQGLLNIS